MRNYEDPTQLKINTFIFLKNSKFCVLMDWKIANTGPAFLEDNSWPPFFFKPFLFLNIYLFIYFWLRQVLVVARRTFHCGARASL